MILYEKNKKTLIILSVIAFIVAVTAICVVNFKNNSKPSEPFDVNDIKVVYQYQGYDEEYNEVYYDDINDPDNKVAATYLIKVYNNSDYVLTNVRRIIMTIENKNKIDTGFWEGYVDIEGNSSEFTFYRKFYDSSTTEDEIYNDIKDKKDIVTFEVDGKKYEVTGTWEDCRDGVKEESKSE